MDNLLTIDLWTVVLIVVLSIQATITAYMYEPKWKAFILTLPLPFTFATLAVGRVVDITNIMGLVLMLGFTHLVRVLHYNIKIPIIVAIIISSVAYCVAGGLLVPVLPQSSIVFWIATALVYGLAIYLYHTTPFRVERGHRTELSILLKLPIVALVVFLIVSAKARLHGFVTVFPMLGVVTAYEARHSLWTISRQIPIIMLTITPLMLIAKLTQPILGFAGGLIFGWIVFLAVMIPLIRSRWQQDDKQISDKESECYREQTKATAV